MRRLFALTVAILLVAPLFVALAAGTASANIIATYQINQSIEVSPGMEAHLMYVSVSDETYGGSYAADPTQVIFPILVYQYENHGTVAMNGHLHIRFVDDQGTSYEGSDAGTMDSVKPGGTSSLRSIEVNIPKDRTVTQMVVIVGFDEHTYLLSSQGATATPTPTTAPTASSSATPKGSLCLGLLVLPLTIVGITWLGRRATRK